MSSGTLADSRLKKASLTLSAFFCLNAVALLVGFAATPLLLKWLDEERYGALRALLDWCNYLSLFDLGLGGALAAVVSRAAAQGSDPLEAAVSAGGRAYRQVALWVAGAGVCLALAIPRLVPVSPELAPELSWAAWLAVASALALPFAAARPVLEALQKGYLVNGAMIVQSLMITGVGLALAWAGMGLPGMIGANLAGAAVVSAAMIAGLRATDSRLAAALWRRGEEAAVQAELWRLRRPTFLSRLSGTVALLSDNIIIARLLGPKAVVPFFITQRLPALATSQMQGVGSAVWAGLAEIHHQGNNDLFRERVVELTRLTALAVGALLGPILLLNDEFIRLWVGESRYGGFLLTALAIVNGGLLAIVSLWGWVFTGTGRASVIAATNVVAAAINVVVSLAATATVGPAGPLLGTTAGLAGVMAWQLPRLMAREFGFKRLDLAAAVAAPLLWAAIPIGAAAIFLSRSSFHPDWLGLAASLGGLAAATLAWGWRLALTAAERERWGGRFSQLRRRQQ